MISVDNTTLWLWLLGKFPLSPSKQNRLIEHFKSIEAVYKADVFQYAELGFLKDEEINLLSKKDLDICRLEEEKLQKISGGVITIDSPFYPELLKKIPDAPNVLYYRGKMVDLNKYLCIAMVGTRKASSYGKMCAYSLSKELSQNGVAVVSGLALGIDAKAHSGAVEGGSPTVAVLGCGVDIAYPKTNEPVMKEIIKNGMIISEYPLGVGPEKYHFPKRNRIISGICHGTLVVEADIKSGSLITAKFASEHNRDIFAVPGNINSVYSKGSNFLLKDGAHLVTTAEDVITQYRFDYPELLLGKERKFAPEKEKEPLEKGSPKEKILLAIGNDTVHTDIICQKTGLNPANVNSLLLLMELEGRISKLPGGFYILK